MSDPRFSPELAEALADRIDGNYRRWWVRNLGRAYPWFNARELLWLIGTGFGGAVVWSDDGSTFRLVDTPDGRSLLAARLTAGSGAVRPWETFGLEPFAKALLALLKDPRWQVMTPSWRAKKERVVEGWLQARERDPEALWRFCADPEITVEGDQNWLLRFNAINHRGGVGHWVARGTLEPFALEPLGVTTLAPDGTFFYPEEL